MKVTFEVEGADMAELVQKAREVADEFRPGGHHWVESHNIEAEEVHRYIGRRTWRGRVTVHFP